MSKRGSRNARLYAGKSWSVSAPKGSKKKDKSNKRQVRQRAKELRLVRQFKNLCSKFEFNKEDDEFLFNLEFQNFKKLNSKSRIKAVQNVKSFRLYCRKYNENFDLKNYLKNEFFKIDFKRKFPHIYYFNKKKSGSSKTNEIRPATNKIGDFLNRKNNPQ